MIHCTNCHAPFPEEGIAYRCDRCGGTFDYQVFPGYDPDLLEVDQAGIWQYRHAFGLPQQATAVTLGEGNTPLVRDRVHGRDVWFKAEFQNPSGSHKDRGMSLLVSHLLAAGVEQAVEDSSGNAGASFAAYAARAGIKARVYIPDYASGPKRVQIAAYGAEVIRILGRRSTVTEAVQRAAEQGAVYASHAYLPQLLPGYATLSYEVFEQLGGAPGTLIAPVGHGSLLYGIGRGFENLHRAGLIGSPPRLVGVQAAACAPLWAVHRSGRAGLSWVTEGETVAEGVRVHRPLRGDALLRMVESGQGTFVSVEEESILHGRNELSRRGLYVEITSALVWDALRQLSADFPEPIVVILTGSGLKTSAGS